MKRPGQFVRRSRAAREWFDAEIARMTKDGLTPGSVISDGHGVEVCEECGGTGVVPIAFFDGVRIGHIGCVRCLLMRRIE